MESLAIAGAFDEFEACQRAHFIIPDPSDNCTLTEKAIKFGNSVQASSHSAQNSLFGELAPIEVVAPKIHTVEEFGLIEKLNREKELIGIYLTGHPLDSYALEVKSYTTATTANFKDKANQVVKMAGIITNCNSRFTKKGTRFCSFTLEDYEGSMDVFLFGKDYVEFGNMVEIVGNMVFVTGRYQQRPYGNGDEFEFKISSIELLAEIKDQLTSGIKLTFDLNKLDEELIDNVVAVIENHPGKYNVSMEVLDHEERYKIDFYSKSKRVDVSQDFIDELLEAGDVEYKLNG
jgi:DNA polymerase-3 subunit alpha